MGTMPREEWHNNVVDALRPTFGDAGISIPAKVKVSCGWPCRRALRRSVTGNRAIGQCFAASVSTDGYNEIFISSVIDEAIAVLEVLVHELIHAVDDCANGDRGPFAKMARAVGLTATHAGAQLLAMLKALGMSPYLPSQALRPKATSESHIQRLIHSDFRIPLVEGQLVRQRESK